MRNNTNIKSIMAILMAILALANVAMAQDEIPTENKYLAKQFKVNQFAVDFTDFQGQPVGKIVIQDSKNLQVEDITSAPKKITFTGKLDAGETYGRFTALIYVDIDNDGTYDKIYNLVVDINTPAISRSYTFVNIAYEQVNDLHIFYSENLMNLAPKVSVDIKDKGLNIKDKELDITFKEPLNKGESVTVTAHSEKLFELKSYQWSIIEGETSKPKGPIIKVIYQNIKSEKGVFPTVTMTVPKPVEIVQTDVIYKTNIKELSNPGAKSKDAKSTLVTIKPGTLDDRRQPGRYVVRIDPPDDIYDLVVDIEPSYESITGFINGSVTGSSSNIISIIILAICLIIISLYKKWGR